MISGAASTPSTVTTNSAAASVAGDVIHEQPRLVLAAAVLVLGEDRDEGLREGALGEQPAQQVRDLEGDEERVGERARRRTPGR